MTQQEIWLMFAKATVKGLASKEGYAYSDNVAKVSARVADEMLKQYNERFVKEFSPIAPKEEPHEA